MKMISETQASGRLGPAISSAFSAGKVPGAGLALLLGGSMVASAGPGNDNRAPEVPASIAVGEGFKVQFRAEGRGFQVYTWNGTTWGGPVPDATLFEGERGVVAIHFAGPTWQSESGSKVVGAVAVPPVIVDTNSIPWVLLNAVHTEGPGIFADIKLIQRVNTVGGKAPSAPGTFIGQVARSPYTADYVFYRETED